MISVVLPCYNEEDSISKSVQAIKEILKKYGKEHEIIIVNDGSTDKSLKILNKLEDVHVVNHVHNLGYGLALKTGIKKAKFDTITVLKANHIFKKSLRRGHNVVANSFEQS